MEGVPLTPESATDKADDKAEKSTDKKRDKTTAAHSVAETLFNKSEEKAAETAGDAPKKEATFWERLSGEKDSTPTEPQEKAADLVASDAVALHEATHEHITERQAEVRAELDQTDPNTAEAVAVASDAALLEHARQQLGHPEDVADVVPEEALEAAYTQTIDDVEAAVGQSQAEPAASEAAPPDPAEKAPAPPAPPVPPISSAFGPPPVGGYNRASQPVASSAESVTERDQLIANAYAYRRGRADGFFTGGLFGYFYGRRRGRKKAEKRFKPVQERLEKRLKQVTEKLTRREHDIRTLAEQKLEQAPQPVQYEKVVEKLTPQPAMPLTIETMPLPTAATIETATNKQPTAAELARSRSEYAGIVPFNTPIEELSSHELKAIAEKVIVDHIPLKEMYEAGQFDEKGLRRIVNEFLRGGDVQRAITKEVIRKDKAFELDPRLRQQASDDAVSGGGTGAGGTIEGQYRELPSESGQLIGQPPKAHKQLPELGESAMQELKRKQVLSIAGVTVIVIIAIILALVATS